MEGGGKVKKSRTRTKPYGKNSTNTIISPPVEGNTITPGNSGEVAIATSTTGNAGEATTSDENATEDENPLSDMFTINYLRGVLCTVMVANINMLILQQELFLINPWKCTRNM